MKIIRCYVIFILITILLITFSSCSPLRSAYSICEGLYENITADIKSLYNENKYDADWMIGKTSQEIIDRYGLFNMCSDLPDEDGLFRNRVCGYITRERTHGFMDAHREEFLFIYFNSDGIAYDYEWDKLLPGG